MRIRSFFGALALGLLGATTASAATILYDFTDNLGDGASSVSYTVDGITLNVDAAGPGAVANVNRGGRGLGVSPGSEGGRLANGESLTFTVVGRDISSLVATIWERGPEDEDFSVLVNGVSTDFTILGGGPGQSTLAFDLSSLFLVDTNTFTITSNSPNGPGRLGIRVGEVEIGLTTIPLPAGGALLLTGLLGLGVAKRRKKTS